MPAASPAPDPVTIRLRVSIVLAGLLLLAACAPSGKQTATSPLQQRIAAAVAETRWELQGKIGVRAAGKAGSAFLNWRQRDDDYRLVLNGALGLGRLTIEGDNAGVTVTDARGNRVQRSDPDALLAELWGWPVPVRALRFWVRGVPDPARPWQALEPGPAGEERFAQDGWEIEASGFGVTQAPALPQRVRASGHDAQITLVVSRREAAP